MATIKEVSELAGVSISTVSRVINGNRIVVEEKRKRVLAAMEQLNYSPNTFAQSLATNRANAIGVVVNDLSSPFYGGMLHGIEEVINATDLHLIISSGQIQETSEKKAVEFLLNRRCDALIVHLESISDQDLSAWAKRGKIVLVDRYVEEMADRCIYLDNQSGGKMATEHLIQKGHRRIAHITGHMGMHDSCERLEGYRDALEEAGIAYDPNLVVEGNFREESGSQAMQHLLDKNLDFTALFVGNDQMSAGAISAIRKAGMEIPKDYSIIGFDDILFARYLYPALTTIRLPISEMGRVSAQMAIQMITGEKVSIQQKFSPKLIERDSVRQI